MTPILRRSKEAARKQRMQGPPPAAEPGAAGDNKISGGHLRSVGPFQPPMHPQLPYHHHHHHRRPGGGGYEVSRPRFPPEGRPSYDRKRRHGHGYSDPLHLHHHSSSGPSSYAKYSRYADDHDHPNQPPRHYPRSQSYVSTSSIGGHLQHFPSRSSSGGHSHPRHPSSTTDSARRRSYGEYLQNVRYGSMGLSGSSSGQYYSTGLSSSSSARSSQDISRDYYYSSRHDHELDPLYGRNGSRSYDRSVEDFLRKTRIGRDSDRRPRDA